MTDSWGPMACVLVPSVTSARLELSEFLKVDCRTEFWYKVLEVPSRAVSEGFAVEHALIVSGLLE